MPKPQKKHQKKQKPKRKLKETQKKSPKQIVEISDEISSREDKNIVFRKSFLIVCEGEAEAAYFEGLCETWGIRTNFKIEILPKKNHQTAYLGSAVKGLLYMAMKIQKKAQDKIPHDEVWIVVDNDEENAFKLDNKSLTKIQQKIPDNIHQKLKALQKYTMKVRKGENEERVRYFLSRQDYEEFLKNSVLILDEDIYIEQIISQTSKKQDFRTLYEGNRKAFFYDSKRKFKTHSWFEKRYFDEKILNQIHVAYSCISFEHWILLHFELNQCGFYNSREIIKYFDDQAYFNSTFDKGWYLYKKVEGRLPEIITTFFKKALQAIKNNILLKTANQSKINTGRKFYEINPYSDMYNLTSLLLEDQNITVAYLDKPISFRSLDNILFSSTNSSVDIEFTFNKNLSFSKIQMKELFSILDMDDKVMPIDLNFLCNDIIRQGDFVKIEILMQENHTGHLFLILKEIDQANTHLMVCAL